MTIYDFPDGIFPEAGTGGYCEPISIVQKGKPSAGGVVQRRLRGAGEAWRQEFTIVTEGEAEQQLARILALLRGPYHTLRCPDLYAYARQVDATGSAVYKGSSPLFSDGSYFSDGTGWASDSAPVITLNGSINVGDTEVDLTIDNIDPTVLDGLDRIQIGDHLYAVLSFDYLTGIAEIHPPIRKQVSSGASVTSHRAQGLWYLESAEMMTSDHVWHKKKQHNNTIRRRKITLIEDLTV